MTIVQAFKYECKFCGKGFTTESWFMSHKCKQMLRDDQLKSVAGNQAWELYQQWMLSQRKVVNKKEVFIDSRYFSSFLKFADWSKQVGLPDYKMFINYVIAKKISPTIWTNDEIYADFINYYDTIVDPMEHARVSFDTLCDISNAINVHISNVFKFMEPSLIISKIRQRKLSPWVLLNSIKFTDFYTNISDHQRIGLEVVIKPAHWSKQFDLKPDVVEMMKMLCEQVGI